MNKKVIGKTIYFIFLIIVFLCTCFYMFLNIKNAYLLENRLESIISTLLIGFITIGFIIGSLFIKGKKIIIPILTSFVILSYFLFNIGIKMDIINIPKENVIPDFTKMSIVKVMDWGLENKIEILSTYEYSDNVDFNYVVSQDIKTGTLIKDIEELEVVLSNGPDLNKVFMMPDVIGLKLDELLEIIKDNHLSNVNIDFILSDEEKEIILSQDIKGEIKRNTLINIEVSLGNIDDLKPTSLIDLNNMSFFEATLFLKRNGLLYELKYEFSDTVIKNNVISFTPKKGTIINPLDDNAKVILVMSKGKAIIVPDIYNMSKEDIIKWAALNMIRVNFQEKYHEIIKKGKVIEANYKKDDKIEQSITIEIVLSKGQLIIPKIDSAIELKRFCSEYNITYNETYQFSDLPAGFIININKKEGDTITNNDIINVTISQGKAITILNYYGMSKTNIQTSCNKLNLKCSFIYGDYGSVGKDNAVAQNKKEGTQVVSGSSLTITLSKGNPETFTVILQPSWFTTQNSTTTINFLKNYLNEASFPGVTFNIKTQISNLSSGLYLTECSNINTGSKVTQGKSYTICISQ